MLFSPISLNKYLYILRDAFFYFILLLLLFWYSKKLCVANSFIDLHIRLILSDGEYFMQAMLATQLNHLLTNDPPAFEKNTVVKLITYACNVVQNRR